MIVDRQRASVAAVLFAWAALAEPERAAAEDLNRPVVAAAPAEAEYRIERNVVYVRRGPRDLHLDAYLPKGDGPFPAVLIVHGGAWMSGSKIQLAGYAHLLVQRGFACFAINYRLAPEHRFPAQIEDCRAAVVWIRQNAAKYRVDPDRLGAFGYSAGGQLVALLGVTGRPADTSADQPETRLQAVVAGGAPCDFRQLPANSRYLAFWLGGPRKELPEQYQAASPAAFVSAAAPPMFFFGGTDDGLVKPDTAEGMVKALQAAGADASMYLVPGGTHIDTPFRNEALQRTVEFFVQRLMIPADSR